MSNAIFKEKSKDNIILQTLEIIALWSKEILQCLRQFFYKGINVEICSKNIGKLFQNVP